MPSRVAPRNTSLDSFSLLPSSASQSLCYTGRNPTVIFLSALRSIHQLRGWGGIRPEDCCYGLCVVEVKMRVQESDCLIAAPRPPICLHLSLSPPSLLGSPRTPTFSTLPSSLPRTLRVAHEHPPPPPNTPGRRREPYRLSMKPGIISFDGLDNSRSQSNE